MTLPEIAAEARRIAENYRAATDEAVARPALRQLLFATAAEFDRLAEMAEPKPMTGMQMGVPMAGVPMKGLEP